MSWPWRRHREEAAADHAAAVEALADVDARWPETETLARELESIRRRNGLAPRIAAAFVAGRHGRHDRHDDAP